MGNLGSIRENLPPPSKPESIKIGARVIWLRENIKSQIKSVEPGFVRWLGFLKPDGDLIAGIEFDNPLGLGSGWYDDVQLFTCQENHGGLIAVVGLIMEQDYNKFLNDHFEIEPKPTPSSSCGCDHNYASGQTSSIVDSRVDDSSGSSNQTVMEEEEVEVEEEPVVEIHFKNKNKLSSSSNRIPIFSAHSSTASDTEIEELHRAKIESQNIKKFPQLSQLKVKESESERGANPKPESQPMGVIIKPKSLSSAARACQVASSSDSSPDGGGSGEGSSSYSPNLHNETPSDKPRYAFPAYHTKRPAYIEQPFSSFDLLMVQGQQRGIQGYNNSCYLDATLFCMFSFNSVFDSILLRPTSTSSTDLAAVVKATHPEGSIDASSSAADDHDYHQLLKDEVQSILRDSIINPLRKHCYLKATQTMKLRRLLAPINPNFLTEEMDPQEFLEILFHKVYKLPGFLSIISAPVSAVAGQPSRLQQHTEFFHQILVPAPADKTRIPSVQELLEESFQFQNLRFSEVPSPALILLMPRSGNTEAVYQGVLPNLTLDITRLLAKDENENSEPTERTRTVKLELLAVICIHASAHHFVSYVRTGRLDSSSWVLFDSMYIFPFQNLNFECIPAIAHLPNMGTWLKQLGEIHAKKSPPLPKLDVFEPEIQQLISDIYICFYTPADKW